MPVYEYRCKSCGHKYSRLVGVVAEGSGPECPHCGGDDVEKLFSRFAKLRGEDAILERMADPGSVGDPDDPASVRRWMRKMGTEMGEDFGDEVDAMLESEEAGNGIDTQDEA